MRHYKVKAFSLYMSPLQLCCEGFLLFSLRELIMEENTPSINVVAAEAVTNVEIPGVCSWDVDEEVDAT